MTKKPGPAQRLKREYLDDRTPDESQPESDAEVLRQLGWWLLPANGDEPEVQD